MSNCVSHVFMHSTSNITYFVSPFNLKLELFKLPTSHFAVVIIKFISFRKLSFPKDTAGVYLTKWQLDDALDQAGSLPTCLMRNLSAFFTPSVMARPSCLGTRHYPGLNKDVVAACFRKHNYIIQYKINMYISINITAGFTQVNFKHPTVARLVLVDATNDKCVNYRRKTWIISDRTLLNLCMYNYAVCL